MKRKINTFMKFINESEGTLPAALNVFFDKLEDVVRELDMHQSYSEKAKDNKIYTNKNYGPNSVPQDDYQAMLKALEKVGYDKPTIDKMFDDYGDIVAKIYNDQGADFGSTACSGFDIFLYYQTNGKVILAGYDYQEAIKNADAGEYWIKYSYGYQRSPYGKLVLAQQLGTVQEWMNYAGVLFIDGLFADEGISDCLQNYGYSDDLKDLMVDDYKFDHTNKSATLDLESVKAKLDGQGEYEKFVKTLKDVMHSMGFKIPGNTKSYQGPGRAEFAGDIVKIYF